MRTDWEQDELISVWTLVEGDWDLVGEKVGAGRLGFALILKFYKIERRFPVARWNGSSILGAAVSRRPSPSR